MTHFSIYQMKGDWHVWAKLLLPVGEFYREDNNVGVLLDHCEEQDEPKGNALNLPLNLCSIPELWP